jgi:hypothetical protein
MTDYGLDNRGSISGNDKIFSVFHTISALGSIRPSIEWVHGLFPRELSGGGVKLTTLLHLVPRSRKVEL